jgi:hypothetical protein
MLAAPKEWTSDGGVNHLADSISTSDGPVEEVSLFSQPDCQKGCRGRVACIDRLWLRHREFRGLARCPMRPQTRYSVGLMAGT